MDKQVSLNVNLLKKKGTPALDIFIHWAITGGRFIVILTETLALAAFLYRFTLDRQIVDLHDKIKQEQAIVASQESQETMYRELQERILQTKQLSTNLSFTSTLFTKIETLGNQANLTFKAIETTDEIIHIEVITGDIVNLKQFVGQLQEQKELKDISIDRIEDRTTSAQILAVISAHVTSPQQQISGGVAIPTPPGGTQ